ncbi:unnamed protein product [Schistosoma curassoni]|uniref:Uncharacterized protein n=1 Tax=Schistosoma curassoni TaxID=6186 RepID=A0A183KRS2_9TREM|nr:unnamed protein product [Schistosoma curassoni]
MKITTFFPLGELLWKTHYMTISSTINLSCFQ